MYNLNGENVNDNPNGFSGNEPTGTPNPDNTQMNYGQPAPEQQTYSQPDNGPQTYDAPNANQQQAFNQTDYNANSFNQNDYNQNSYNQSAFNQPNYGQQAFNNGNTYNAAPSYNANETNGNAPKKSCVFGVLGLILGIAALPFGWFVPIIGIILGIAAIILSIFGLGKNRDLRGAAIAGLIISIIATIFSIGVIVYAVVTVSKTLSNATKDILNDSGITSDLDDFDFDYDSDDDDDYSYDDSSYADEGDKEVPLDNVVLFSANDVTITATSITYSYYEDTVSPSINITIENNSSTDIGLNVDKSAVNGVTMYSYISGDVAAGKKSNTQLNISSDEFSLAGFKTIDSLKLQMILYDADSYDTIYADSEATEISFSDSYTPFSVSSLKDAVALDSGNGVNVYYVGTTTGWDDSLEFVFYIENTSDAACVAESDDFSINDFMQDDYGYSSILAGTGAFMTIDANDDITSLDDVTSAAIKFEVRDYDSYQVTYTSDELTFISNN